MNHDHADVRRAAIHRLCVAQAREIISVDVFELRLALLNEAPTAAAIEAIVADLDVNPLTGSELAPLTPAGVTAASAWPSYAGAPFADSLRLQAVFSTNRRTGRLEVPPEIELKALFGELHLDLRDAGFVSDVLHIEVDVFFGTIVVTVPAGTEVANECSAFMGSATSKVDAFPDVQPNGLYVRITGKVVMGELKVRARLPTELLPPARQRAPHGWLGRVADSID